MNIVEKLKQKWEIRSNSDFWRIIAVFSLAGMNVSLVRKPLFHFLGLGAGTAFWLKTITYIAFVFPTYQTSLLLYGVILGEFDFFSEKQKKLMRFIRRKFTRTHTASNISKPL